MGRPSGRQWIVLWVGAICILLALAISEDYVLRAVFGVVLVTALLYWQLTPKVSAVIQPKEPRDGNDIAVEPAGASVGLEPPKALVGVTGWLAVFVAIFGFVIPLSSLAQIGVAASAANSASDLGGQLVALALFAVGGLYFAFAMIYHWPNSPRIATWYIAILALIFLIRYVAALNMSVADSEAAGQKIGGPFVLILIWAIYLKKSRRVRDTYSIENGASFSGKTAARLGALALFMLLLVIGAAAFSHEQNRIESRFAEISPYEWVKASRQMGTEEFDRGFEKGILKRLQSGFPNATIKLSKPTDFVDLSSAFRSSTSYTIKVREGTSESISLDGEFRTYFHPGGIATIESGCIPSLVKCQEIISLLSEAEEKLIADLGGSELNGILPGGNCSKNKVSQGQNKEELDAMICAYTKNNTASLSLTRIGLQEATASLRGTTTTTPTFKRMLVGIVYPDRKP